MFNLFKKSKKQNISTETMSIDEYVAAIKPKVAEALADPYILERLDGKHILDEKAKFKKGLSFDELRECSNRLSRILTICGKFREHFEIGLDALDKRTMSAEEETKFLTATNIVEIIEKANSETPMKYDENDTRDAETMAKGNDIMLGAVQKMFNVALEAEVLFIKGFAVALNVF